MGFNEHQREENVQEIIYYNQLPAIQLEQLFPTDEIDFRSESSDDLGELNEPFL
jgi:hypothetical protein